MANEVQRISNDIEQALMTTEHSTVKNKLRCAWSGLFQVVLKDNVLDVAVGLIFATALTSVVNSLVSDIILPLMSLALFMSRNLDEKFLVLREGPHFDQGYNTRKQAIADGAVVLTYGAFMNQFVNFVGIGLVLYLIANVYKRFIHDCVIRHTTECEFCGKENSFTPEELQTEVEPKSVKEFQNLLKTEIAKDKTFERFFAPNDPFIEQLAENANAITQDETTDLGKPENIKHLTQLSLYAPIIYCDDSGSMRHEHRYENQIELVKRIARIATKIVPEHMSGVELRFINSPFAEQVTSENIQEAMKRVPAKGTTNIGTNLRTKILEPFVYNKISQPLVLGKPFAFTRPLLVCIITDGVPDPEATNTLRDEIMFCKKELKKWKYDPTAVKFCISQIGTCTDAKEFLNGVRNEQSIQDVVYCTVGELDTEFAKLKDNERALESWLLHVLTKPIMTNGAV